MSSLSRLKLAVVSYNGPSIGRANSQTCCEFNFDEQIFIGRNGGNHLVLDDPSRVISRVQARVSFKDNSSAIIENVSASTSVFINTSELRPGESALLNCMDTLMVGAYILKLYSQTATVFDDQAAQSAPNHQTVALEAVTSDFIPEDIDFLSVGGHSLPSDHTALNTDMGLDSSDVMDLTWIENTDEPVDKSLGHLLKEQASNDAIVSLMDNDKNRLIAGQNYADSHQTSLASLLASVAETPAVVTDGDRVLEVESLFVVPRPVQPVQMKSIESANVVSGRVPAASTAECAKENVDASNIIQISETECRQAFARALQIDIHKLPAFTPAFFEQLGDILLHLTAGTVNMMHGRAKVKHEMRADVTIIAASGNNPLKFAPDAQSAIPHLLGEPIPGFMRAKDAIDDAVDDLLAHQIGLMSGARAAVYEVVKNFSPEKIQKYISSTTIVDSFLPMSKKSKLWELYETHYAEVAGNAREEFEMRFQQAFAQAYEQEVDRMCEARELA